MDQYWGYGVGCVDQVLYGNSRSDAEKDAVSSDAAKHHLKNRLSEKLVEPGWCFTMSQAATFGPTGPLNLLLTLWKAFARATTCYQILSCLELPSFFL